MLLVDVAPDFEHVGDHGEIAVEVRLRTWVRGGRVRHDLGLEFAGQGAEQRLEVVPPRRGSGRVQRQRLEPNLYRKRIEHEARHEQELQVTRRWLKLVAAPRCQQEDSRLPACSRKYSILPGRSRIIRSRMSIAAV